MGKTTLLKNINNEFLKTKLGFDVVIWVVVSKPINTEKVQEVILNKLEVPRYQWEYGSKDEKSQKIFNILKTKKFVLLLDDIWERLDLTELGVPHPNGDGNISKVIFTTRSEEVCHVMEAHQHQKLECLASDEALSLFRMKVGEDTFNSHPEIPTLAEEIVKECKGLPLALITIGRAMADKKTLRRWDRALQVLKTYSSTFSGVEDQVLSILASSYHNLSNGPIKSCFLYCSMFPSDYEILEDELVEFWIGEGFLTESHDIQRARDEGYDIIKSLKEACLLDSSDQSEKHVKMHDMIRDMALWLTTKPGENKKVVVKERARMVESRDLAKLKEAHRISLWDIGTQSLENVGQEVPFFLDVETLFLRRSSMYEIPTGFLDKMHLFRVLDLSHNYRLKNCGQLNQLVNLEYLNLSFTSIYSFWNIVQGLKKLRSLILHLKEIRISNLSSLQLFSMHGDHLQIPCDEQKALLKELESMKDIKEISVIQDNDILVKIAELL